MKLSKEELLAFLKTPEAKEVLAEPEDFKEIEMGENDRVEDVVRKFNAELKKMHSNFNSRLQSVKAETVEEALRPAKESQAQAIINFKKANPGMSRQEVIDIMDPLYASGKSLEDAYKIACKSLDLNPTTGTPVDEETPAPKKDEPAVKTPKPSLKSDVPEDDGADEPKGSGGKKEELSLMDVLKANANRLDASTDPFKEVV